MYQNLQVNPIINGIMCVSYEELSLNTNTNNRCLETFPQGIPDNATPCGDKFLKACVPREK